MNLKSTLLVVVAMGLAQTGQAHENKIKMTNLHLSAALEQFESKETALAESFTGVKAWPYGHSVKVRIYVGKQGSILYSCKEVEEDGAEKVVCEK